MQPQRSSTLMWPFLIAVGILLNAAGNLAANQMSAALPEPIAAHPLLWYSIVTLLFMGTTLAIYRQQRPDGNRTEAPRSIWRRRLTMVLLALSGVLSFFGGALGNSAGGMLQPVSGLGLPILLAAVGLGPIIIPILIYQIENAPRIQATNRRNFLSRLQKRYAHRLHDALQDAVRITLKLQADPQAIAKPSLALSALENGPGQSRLGQLSTTTDVVQAFAHASGQLLILGEPGAGKTTLLIELGLDLLRRARQDLHHPIPVIFNLSAWAINRKELSAWLVEELAFTFEVPNKLARAWVDGGAVIPLLDGLDEVEPTERESCCRAINHYHEVHRKISLVVCCREAEYRALKAPLDLHTAVIVQPLGDEQVAAYLAAFGAPLQQLASAITARPALREVVRTPLMLNLITVTYQDLPQDALPPPGDDIAWRRQLFQDYTTRMLERERKGEIGTVYSRDDVERYLAWLGAQMRGHSLTEFYLERMQPDWLPKERSEQRYARAVRVYGGFLIGGVGSLLTLLVCLLWIAGYAASGRGYYGGVTVEKLVNWTLVAALTSVLLAAFGALLIGLRSRLAGAVAGGIFGALVVTMIPGLGIAVFQTYAESNIVRASGGQPGPGTLLNLFLYLVGSFITILPFLGIFGAVVGAVVGALVRVSAASQAPTSRLAVSWRHGILYGLMSGLILGLGGLAAMLTYVQFSSFLAPRDISKVTAVCALGGAILGLIYGGLVPLSVSDEEYSRPDEGVRRSAARGVFATLLFFSVITIGLGGAIYVLFSLTSLPSGLSGVVPALSLASVAGLFAAPYGGLRLGGAAAMRSVALRHTLRWSGVVPPRYVRFLDYAADHILLQKIGAGYRFIHPLLRDYLADLWPQVAIPIG